MGRAAIPVDKIKLQAAIDSCELKETFSKRQPLWEAVALSYASVMQIESVSPVWVYLRVEELGLKVKTPKGKKGRAAGSSPITGVVRTTRAEKFEASPVIVNAFDSLEKIIKKEQKGRFMPVFERAKKGSVKALVKLKCLDCANYQTTEVKLCPCTDCPLYSIRPYQTSILKEEVEEDEIHTDIQTS